MRFIKYTLSILMAIIAFAYINIANAADTPSLASGGQESEIIAIEVLGQVRASLRCSCQRIGSEVARRKFGALAFCRRSIW